MLEACFDNTATRLLLYSENLTEHFFDLSSGAAGEMLQKLSNYNIRRAIVRAPSLHLSRRFDVLMTEESCGSYFCLFDQRAAQEWLCFS